MAIRIEFADQGLRATQTPQRRGQLQLADTPLSQAAAPGLALAAGAQQVGDAAFRYLAQEQQAEQETALLKAKAETTRRLGAVELEVGADEEMFAKRAREVLGEVGQALPDRTTRRRYEVESEGAVATRAFNVRRAGVQRRNGEATAALEEVLGGLSSEAAASGNPVQRERAILDGREAVLSGIRGGFISPERGATRLRQFLENTDEATARRYLAESPARAAAELQDPKALPNITPVRRYQILDQALRRLRVGGVGRAGDDDLPAPPPPPPDLPPERLSAIEGETQRLATLDDERVVAAAAQREAAAAATAQAAVRVREDAVLASFTGDDAVPADLDDWRDLMSPALLRASAAPGAAADDATVVEGLLFAAADADPAEFLDRAAEAVADGLLRRDTMARLVQSNQLTTQDTPAARALREARGAVSEATGIGAMGEFLAGGDRGALRDLQGAAVRQFDDWAAANPDARPAAAKAMAEQIVGLARERIQDRAMAALPRPARLSGLAGPYAPDVLDETEMDILDDLDAGRVEPAAAAADLRLLEAWRLAVPSFESSDDAPAEREHRSRAKSMGRGLSR